MYECPIANFMYTKDMPDEKSMLKQMSWQDLMENENFMKCKLLFQRRSKGISKKLCQFILSVIHIHLPIHMREVYLITMQDVN